MESKMSKPATGTNEWSTSTVNVCVGCSHCCKYCYARAQAARFKQRAPEDWAREEINQAAVEKGYGKRKGRVMLPSTHDITPETVDAIITVASKLLDAGNELLIVSKPWPDHIATLCNHLVNAAEARRRVLFRFTIGSYLDRTLRFWEPGAPTFGERFYSLMECWHHGWQTSVSIEPMLEHRERTVELVEMLAPFVTDSIWLGTMNKARARLKANGVPFDAELEERLRVFEVVHSRGQIHVLYNALKDHPLVRWKESIKRVVGLELATERGLDQ
jgi:DNA repair photolyase